jgi:hypothetical protein
MVGYRIQCSAFSIQNSGGAVRCFFLFALVLIGFAGVQAQRAQVVPPFLRETPDLQEVELEGRTFVVPDFSIAPDPYGAEQALISQARYRFLTVRETSEGFALDTRGYRGNYWAVELFRATPNPLLVTEGLGRTPDGPVFDFSKWAPHLAFFCQLEINEERGGVIPARFRLGGPR